MNSWIGVDVINGVGSLRLDRPEALNALDTSMITDLTAALEGWQTDRKIAAVVLSSSSSKAFCAGGDIRAVRQLVLADEPDTALAFFAAEYRLNLMISQYPKPIVSLVDGINLGGGLGLSVHARHHVVTERAALAMPETSIGFFPDIGASFFLPRLNNGADALGRYLGLTGHRVLGADAVRVGLATHFVPAADLPRLEAALFSGHHPVIDVLTELAPPEPTEALMAEIAAIEQHFSTVDISEINQSLAGRVDAWANQTRAELARASRRSLYLTSLMLQKGATASLRAALDAEYALAAKVITSHDFIEGVRAMLVDKDRKPTWLPGDAHTDAQRLFDSAIAGI